MASANLAEDEEPAAIAASLTLDIWQLLAQVKRGAVYRQIAVLAWGGYGKTTLLRHVAYPLGKNQQPRDVPRLMLTLID
ncbi:hypothetical protein OOK60_00580 [Trichothermofontia sichuanensis B231]|uniref:MGMT family protein n=1 Tax=Trichothermofontia sichuanensis TaxID=3045816 RepID=UPI0022470A09|nr:MGMT family protein [Trichothermofontia sichuanensis]UZQ54606.1 hypothetical protein OOK60_00580 [Trichothermofontia sichuanensis B231]